MTDTPNPAATGPDAADPSMEEILASIRRILNEDDAQATPHAAGEAPTNDPAHDDVLILEPSMLVTATDSAPGAVQAEPDSGPGGTEPKADASRQAMEAPTSVTQADSAEQSADLVAPETAAAAAFSINSLVRTLAAGRPTHVYAGGPTLEDIVRSELRPLLKEWLDVNLPPVVERLVRAEIEKVVGRAAS